MVIGLCKVNLNSFRVVLCCYPCISREREAEIGEIWECYSKNGVKINKDPRLWEGKIMFFRGGTVDLSGARFPKEIQIPWPLSHSNGKSWSKLSPSLISFCSWLQLIAHTQYCSEKVRCQPEGRKIKSFLLNRWHDLLPCLSCMTAKKRNKIVLVAEQLWAVLFTIMTTTVEECTWCPHPKPFQGCFCESTSESAQVNRDMANNMTKRGCGCSADVVVSPS